MPDVGGDQQRSQKFESALKEFSRESLSLSAIFFCMRREPIGPARGKIEQEDIPCDQVLSENHDIPAPYN
jgi:hypothetical protein